MARCTGATGSRTGVVTDPLLQGGRGEVRREMPGTSPRRRLMVRKPEEGLLLEARVSASSSVRVVLKRLFHRSWISGHSEIVQEICKRTLVGSFEEV